MPIEVARRTDEHICERESGFAVAVYRPDSRLRAAAALRAASADMLALSKQDLHDHHRTPARPARVSNIVMTPDGPLVYVTELEATDADLRTIPDLVVARLEEAGVSSAQVLSPRPEGLLDGLDITPSAVVLRVFPMPGTLMPLSWVDMVHEWSLADSDPNDDVYVRVLHQEWQLHPAEAFELVHEANLAGAWCDVVAGRLGKRVHTASLTFGRAPHVSFAIGGAGIDARGRSARANLLREVARELAPTTAYACIDFEPNFANIGLGLTDEGWPSEAGPPANRVAAELLDTHVPDVYWYQVLNPKHVEALGNDLGDPLPNGRLEVTFGSASTWMVEDAEREAIRSDGWELFAPVLAREDQFDALTRSRPPVPSTLPPLPTPAERAINLRAAVPFLEGVRVIPRPRGRRASRQSTLELASWFGRERYTATPSVVTPVLASMLDWLGQSVPDPVRESLHGATRKAVLASLDPFDRVQGDHLRAWMAVEWLVKMQATEWLRAAKVASPAETLEKIPSLSDPTGMVKAADVLAEAIDVLGPLLDDVDPDLDSAVWSEWERCAEISGLVAASQAALTAIPRGVIDRTDTLVIETARDPHIRLQVEQDGDSLAETTWKAALHALAEISWHRAWDETSEVALEVLGSNALDHRHRVLGATDVLGAEAAEEAGISRLAERMFGAESDKHPFDDAIDAAATCPDGDEWRGTIDAVRTNLGPTAWGEALGRARSAVAESSDHAPDVVARASIVSLAREAVTLSARLAAIRVMRNVGGDPEEVATQVLAPPAQALGDSSLRLLNRMIEV